MSKDEEQLEQRSLTIFSITKNRRVAHTGGMGNRSDECEEYARRIVASWNACKGIETETLESRAVEPCDICGAASHNLRANRAEARADTATALLTEARDFIRAEYNALLDSACLKDESNHPRRDTLDPYAAEHVGAYEALLAKLDEALK